MRSLFSKKAENFTEECNHEGVYITPEFNTLLKGISSGDGIDQSLLALFEKTEKIEINLGLLKRFLPSLALYIADNVKDLILAKIYNMYFEDIHGEYKYELRDIFISISASISDPEIHKKWARMATHLLAEDPCNTTLKDQVLRLLQKTDPNFRFSD